MKKFSIVIPVKNEEHYIRQNLPSYCALNPDEIILCFDNPAPRQCVEVAQEITKQQDVNIKILEVERNPEYRFQQAWIRRRGFMEARNDIILTGDIDLQVYPTCLKAIQLVGKRNIGLVSLLKERHAKGVYGRLRGFMDSFLRPIIASANERLNLVPKYKGYFLRKGYFTGLYSLYRPYWLDSEDKEGIKHLQNPKKAEFVWGAWGGYLGEDTHLKHWMEVRHRCLFLPDIGATDYGIGLEEVREIQTKIGKKFAVESRKPYHALTESLINCRPYSLGSYIHHLTYISRNFLRVAYLILMDLFAVVVKGITCFYVWVLLRPFYGPRQRDLVYQFLKMRGKRFYDKVTSIQETFKRKMLDEMYWTKLKMSEEVDKVCIRIKDYLKSLEYETDVSEYVKKLSGKVFVDVGANVGYYSLLLKDNFEEIYAFEPLPHTYILLNKVKDRFGGNNITTIDKAVSDRNGMESFSLYFLTMAAYGPTIDLQIGEKSVSSEPITVESVTLSSYFPKKEIDLVKVDVEGNEWKVLEGAKSIMQNIKRWIIELHDDHRRQELEHLLDSYGYSIRWLDEHHVLAERV